RPLGPAPLLLARCSVQQLLLFHQLEVLQLDPPRQRDSAPDSLEELRGHRLLHIEVAGVPEPVQVLQGGRPRGLIADAGLVLHMLTRRTRAGSFLGSEMTTQRCPSAAFPGYRPDSCKNML